MINYIAAAILSIIAGPTATQPVEPERTVSLDLEYSCQGVIGTVTFTGDAVALVASGYVPGEGVTGDALIDPEPGTHPVGSAPYPSGTVVTSWVTMVYADGETVTALDQGVIPAGC